jgi:L-asparaginase
MIEPNRNVMVLGTGGTIAGEANGLSSGGYASGRVAIDDLVDPIQFPDGIDVVTRQIAHLPGQDIGEAAWRTMIDAIDDARRQGTDGVVIVQGTDTIDETALVLALTCDADMAIVITGAVRPNYVPGADGPANVRASVVTAASPQSSNRKAMVVFDNTIFAAASVSRTSLTSTREFEAGPDGALGTVSVDKAIFWRPTGPAGVRLAMGAEALPCVEILFGHADADARLVHDAVSRGANGIVWAGTGSGNAPRSIIQALAEAATNGCAIVRASRIPRSGLVLRNIEIDDDTLGFVASLGLDAPQARILLQLALANDHRNARQIQALFTQVSGLTADA